MTLFEFPSKDGLSRKKSKAKLMPQALNLSLSDSSTNNKLEPCQLSSPTTGTLPPISEKSHANPGGPSHSAWQTVGGTPSTTSPPTCSTLARSASTASSSSTSQGTSSLPFPSRPPLSRQSSRRSSRSLKYIYMRGLK